MHGLHKDRHVEGWANDLSGGAEAIELGHLQVEQRNVEAVQDYLLNGFPTPSGVRDHVEAGTDDGSAVSPDHVCLLGGVDHLFEQEEFTSHTTSARRTAPRP